MNYITAHPSRKIELTNLSSTNITQDRVALAATYPHSHSLNACHGRLNVFKRFLLRVCSTLVRSRLPETTLLMLAMSVLVCHFPPSQNAEYQFTSQKSNKLDKRDECMVLVVYSFISALSLLIIW
jgi:hypothetical protein